MSITGAEVPPSAAHSVANRPTAITELFNFTRTRARGAICWSRYRGTNDVLTYAENATSYSSSRTQITEIPLTRRAVSLPGSDGGGGGGGGGSGVGGSRGGGGGGGQCSRPPQGGTVADNLSLPAPLQRKAPNVLCLVGMGEGGDVSTRPFYIDYKAT